MSTDERIKKITDIIIEWAEQKAEDGELKLDNPFCDYYSDHSMDETEEVGISM